MWPGPADLQPHILLTASQWGLVAALITTGLGIKAWLVWWIWRDAVRRGTDPRPWAIGTAILDLFALIVWRIARPRPTGMRLRTESNPRQQAAVQSDAWPSPGAARSSDDPTGTIPDPSEAVRAGQHPVTEGTRPANGNPPPTADQVPTNTVRTQCPGCQTELIAKRRTDGPTPLICPACGRRGKLP